MSDISEKLSTEIEKELNAWYEQGFGDAKPEFSPTNPPWIWDWGGIDQGVKYRTTLPRLVSALIQSIGDFGGESVGKADHELAEEWAEHFERAAKRMRRYAAARKANYHP